MKRRPSDYDIILPRLDPRMWQSGTAWRPDFEDHVKVPRPPGEDPHDWWDVPTRVRWNSPISLRRAVVQLAKCFRREFGYDFVQYDEDEEPGKDVVLLWTTDTSYDPEAFGACCFRWREWRDAPPSWALAWVWFHPYERRQGHLSEVWPYIEARFGRFYVEGPLSEPMFAFLQRHRHWTMVEPWPRQEASERAAAANNPDDGNA